MTRIVYLAAFANSTSGGNKVIFRHVEALCAMGFDAVVRRPAHIPPPDWFRHDAPTEDAATPLRDDDVLVLAEDMPEGMRFCAGLPNRKVIFCQNPYAITSYGLAALEPELRAHYRTFMACNAGVAALIARYFEYDLISMVPAFADERIFAPAAKQRVIATSPRKRQTEFRSIRFMFERLYPDAATWRWDILENATEEEVAQAMGRASVFLNLSRMEAHSITTLEAMACECLVTGFRGVGPQEYTTPTNGLWVEEDDCEAAARALVRAVLMAEQAGGEAALMRHAAAATARQWSHAAFVQSLGVFWRDRMGVTA